MISTLLNKHNFNTVFDSQKVYRYILNAMAHPTSIVNINEYASKLYGKYPEFLAVAMTLLDNEVSFFTCEDRLLAEEIASLTLAENGRLHDADFIFVIEPEHLEDVIRNAKCGTLTDPHKSAVIVVRNDKEPKHRLRFVGPGIDGCTELDASEVVKHAVELRDLQSYEYPQGIDLLFLSSEGELSAIPRLTRMEVV